MTDYNCSYCGESVEKGDKALVFEGNTEITRYESRRPTRIVCGGCAISAFDAILRPEVEVKR